MRAGFFLVCNFTLNLLYVNIQEYLAYFEAHPMKEKAAGRPVIVLPLVLFSDDTSGNKSKKWHKFDS